VFSGLDSETEEQVFNRLLGTDGLFRQLGTTVILVTHAVRRLSYCSHIIALNKSGQISEQGSYDELKMSAGYVQSLSTKLKGEDVLRPTSEKAVESSRLDKPLLNAEVEELETDELNRKTGDLKVYKYYFASIGWLRCTPFVVSVIMYGVAYKLTEFLLTYCKCLPAFQATNPD